MGDPSRPRSAPVSPRGRSFTPDSYDFDGYAVRGLSHVLRAAEQQRKSQLRRLQHLKLTAEKEASKQRQAEIMEAMEQRKQELIALDRKYRDENLAVSKAEAEAKRQQTLYNSAVIQEHKRRQAEHKVLQVEEQAAKHNFDKERDAALRREYATERESYRQTVLRRNQLLEEQKRQEALMKGAQLEEQLRRRAKEQAIEERIKAEEQERAEQHRRWVLERGEMEADLKREQRLRAQAEKHYVASRNQAELEMEAAQRKEALRQLDEQRKAKAAHAAHLEELAREHAGRRYVDKVSRVDQIEAERAQVLDTMTRLRQEMSMQEEAFRQTLEQMKIHNKYNSHSLMDFSRSMTDVSRYLSPGGASPATSRGRRAGHRPQSAPLRKSYNSSAPPSRRSSVHFSPGSQRSSAGVPDSSVSPRAKLNFAAEMAGGGVKGKQRDIAEWSPEAEIPEKISRSALGHSQSWKEVKRVSSPAKQRTASHKGLESRRATAPNNPSPNSTDSPALRKLSERQLELKQLIEQEQSKEQARQALLRQVTDAGEKQRLIKIFTAERERAKERILSLSRGPTSN
eukprot:jgi/Tetstr1/453151/TSEL_040171.t1